ncbi:N/A [soil metagenome]
MDLKKNLEQIVLEKLEDEKIFLVDILISGGDNAQKIQILIDGDEGVDIDQCAVLSRKVGNEIEISGLLSNAYILEVSSPGLDHPLQNLRQLRKNIGRRVQVALSDNKVIKGKLLEVKDDKIKVGEEKKSKIKGKAPEVKEVELNLIDIKKTNVLASFK